jgi:transposase-like protein
MKKISYSGSRFPPEIIDQAIWLDVRFTLSFRDAEDLLAERGIKLARRSKSRQLRFPATTFTERRPGAGHEAGAM